MSVEEQDENDFMLTNKPRIRPMSSGVRVSLPTQSSMSQNNDKLFSPRAIVSPT